MLYKLYMKTLSLYIVYHNNIYDKNTETFHQAHIKQSLIWYAVNENIKKPHYPNIPEGSHIKEWELPIYNPLYQMTHFYQNSAFLHIFWNNLHTKTKYIGFAQYDMSLDANELLTIELHMKKDQATSVFVAFPYDPAILLNNLYTPQFWEIIFLIPYNIFYSTTHTMDNIMAIPIPLLHTFIIPSWFFAHIMPFVEKLIPTVLRNLQWDTRHLAGTLERIFGLCISFGIQEKKINNIVRLHGIVTDIEGQRENDTFRGI